MIPKTTAIDSKEPISKVTDRQVLDDTFWLMAECQTKMKELLPDMTEEQRVACGNSCFIYLTRDKLIFDHSPKFYRMGGKK